MERRFAILPMLGVVMAWSYVYGCVSALAAAPHTAFHDPLHQSLHQSLHQPLHHTLRHWTTQQGLSSNVIYAMLQDRQGFIWLGTDKGLDRFDGEKFIHFRHRTQDVASLVDNTINALAEDAEGHLWIGTPKGLCRMNPATGQCKRVSLRANPSPEPNAHEERIKSLLHDSKGNLWVGTEQRVYVYDYRRHAARPVLLPPPPFPTQVLQTQSKTIRTIHESANGTVWISTAGSALYICPAGQPSAVRTIAVPCTEGYYVVACEEDGLKDCIIVQSRASAQTAHSRRSRGHIEAKCVANYAAECVTVNDRLMAFDIRSAAPVPLPKRWLAVERGCSLNDHVVRSELLQTLQYNHQSYGNQSYGSRLHSTTLYCGVYNQNCPERGGLYALQAHSAPTHLLAGNVSAMMIDRSGRVWAGIGTARQGIGAAQQKESNAVTGAQYNHLTTSTTGLWMLTPSPVRVQTEADGLASRRVFALHQDQTGVIYAGTDKGLHRFDAAAGRWSLVGARPLGRPQPVIHALLEHPTKSNALLLGCESGVMEYTPATDRIEPCAPLQQMLQHKAAGVYRMTYSTIHKELWLSQGFNGVDCFALQPTSSVASQASSQASQQAGSQSSSQASSSQSWRLVRSFGVGDDDESLPSNVVRCLLADDGNSTDNGNGAGVWIGTLSGLVRWEYSTRRLHQYHHDPAQPHSIADNNTIHIITATDGAPRNANDNHDNRTKDIVIAGRGLNIYRPATDDFYTLKERGGVSLDRVCRVQSDERGGFWMVTDKGELLYHNRRTGITKAIACGEQENAAFHLGGTLRSNDGTLWFSAPQGIITFHPDALQAARDARSLVVSAVLRHDTLVAHTMRFASAFADISADTLRVDYGESFGIEVSSPQMTNAAEALYSFHLDGFDAAWSEPSTTRSIRFTNLWPREYTLRAAVIDEYGERSLMPAPLLVVVRPPWWLRWEFGLGVAMLMGAAAWTALRLRLRREQMRRRIAELRLQTLRLQMNPHFLFNSLAAVQDMIDDDPEEAQDYVAAIAKMIRLVLDSSESEVISLDKELAFLSTYLSLEQLRFGTFTYSIRAGEQVHSSSFQPSHFAAWRADRLEQPMEQVYVPVMMVQPLLENAIHHGVRPLGGGGEIHVSLRFVQHPSGQHSCEWVVEDNGIGRVEAASGKRAKEAAWRHLSRSTRVNGERIAAFATLYQAAYQPPLYEDLYDNDGAPCGTRVTLNVPVWDAETVKRVTNAATSVTAATAPTVTTTKQIPSDLPLTAPSTLLPSRLP